jgi:hypothetical protein
MACGRGVLPAITYLLLEFVHWLYPLDHRLALFATVEKKTLHDPKQKQERVQQQRAGYTEELPTLKAEEVIALDEMGAALNLTLLYGRSPTGERVYGAKPTGPGKRISTIGAVHGPAA